MQRAEAGKSESIIGSSGLLCESILPVRCLPVVLLLLELGCNSVLAGPDAQSAEQAESNADVARLVNEACREILAENFQPAIEKLEQALKLDANYAIARQNLAVAYTNRAWKIYKTKNWAEAAPALQKAIEAINRFDRSKSAEIPTLQNCYDFCIKTLKEQDDRQRVISSLAGEPDDYLNEFIPLRFPAARMPLRVFIGSGRGIPGFKDEFIDLFKQSCSDWAEASGGAVSFQFASDSKRADIELCWTDKRDTAIAEGEAGHTRTFPDQSGLDRSIIYMYTIAPDSAKAILDTGMKVACLHELGHALGIQGHSRDPRDIMIPKYHLKLDDTLQTIKLSNRDRNTITRLYSKEYNPATASVTVSSNSVATPADRRNRAIALNNDAVALMQREDYELAIQRLQEGLKLDDTYTTLHENLAIAYYNSALKLCKQKSFDLAEAAAQKALDLQEKAGRKKSPEYQAILQCLDYCGKQKGSAR